MPRFCRLSLAVFALSFFVFANTGCQKKAEEEKVEEKEKYEILTKTADKMTIVYVDHVGPYDQLGPVFGHLAAYAGEKNLALNMVGLYYNDPATVPAESLRCQLGIKVDEEFEPDSGYLLMEIPAHKVVYAIMKGPYEEIATEYDEIMEWMGKRGYKVAGPITEIYLEGGPEVPPEEQVTEVQFPIE